MLAEQQYYEIVEQMQQSDGQQTTERVSPYESPELMDQSEPEALDAWALLAEDDGSAVSDRYEKAALLEKSFLTGLLDDSESGTTRRDSQNEITDGSKMPLTAHERLALEGKGGMPSKACRRGDDDRSY